MWHIEKTYPKSEDCLKNYVFLEGELHRKMNFTLYVRIWVGEWHCESLSCRFSFISENIDQEETSVRRPDGERGSQVTSPSHHRAGLGMCERTAAGRSIAMRFGQRRDSRLLDRLHAPASSRARRRSRDLGSHFVIRVRRARFFEVDFPA